MAVKKPIIVTRPWEELDYWWFRWRGVLNGPYRNSTEARRMIKKKKAQAKLTPLEEEWRKIL